MKKHLISLLVLFMLLSTSFVGVSNQTEKIINEKSSSMSDGGLMNSSWPMFCHDLHHTGRSPYSTATNSGTIKWSFPLNGMGMEGCACINSEGTIYVPGIYRLYAFNINGTFKWQIIINGYGESCPALDKNGTIYFGTTNGDPSYFYAVKPDGTFKWRYWLGGGVTIDSSPAIGPDGTIYFGLGQSIVALFPNGTLRWQHSTGNVVYSSPAIGDDGTVYCGCHDTYLYALYPNNGTVKWRFSTGNWIRVSPCIGDDGTVYCVSLDTYLYALYPNNGTMKWKTYVYAGTSPTVGSDGTIYAGGDALYAINPVNGSVKWSFPASYIEGGTPCTSSDGTIFFGTTGGDLIALNPDGTLLWQVHIGGCESAPAISEDGTIYVGSTDKDDFGYMNAVGRGELQAEANGPYTVYYQQPIQFTGTAYGGILPYTYHWDFGDGYTSNEQNPTHNYSSVGNYTATFTVTDNTGNSSSDTARVTISYEPPTMTITKPVNGLYIKDNKVLSIHKCIIIGQITVEASASQDPLGIARVEFSIDNKLKSTDTEAPYTWTWITPSFSKHTITVTAYDTSEKSTQASLTVWKFF